MTRPSCGRAYSIRTGQCRAVLQISGAYGVEGATTAFRLHNLHLARLLLQRAVTVCRLPKQEAIQSWAQSSGVAGDYAAICRDPKTKAHLLDEINATGKEGKLKVGRF